MANGNQIEKIVRLIKDFELKNVINSRLASSFIEAVFLTDTFRVGRKLDKDEVPTDGRLVQLYSSDSDEEINEYVLIPYDYNGKVYWIKKREWKDDKTGKNYYQTLDCYELYLN